MPRVSLSTSTNFPGNPNALVEDQASELTFTFTLDEPAPAGGLKVYVDSNLDSILNRLDLQSLAFDSSRASNLGINPDGFLDFLNTGFAVTINPGATTATLRVPIFDTDESSPDPFFPGTFDGLDTVTFTLKTRDQISTALETSPYTDARGSDRQFVEGDGVQVSAYTIGTASSTVLFADTASQLPAATPPKFKISATPTTLIEHEGTSVVITIDLVEGTLPSGGVPIRLGTGVVRSLGDFDVFGPPPQATFTGGSFVSGFGDNSGFTFRVTGNKATITLPIYNDDDLGAGDVGFNVNEDTGVETLTFSILPSTAATPAYTVDTPNGSVALTLADTRGQVETIVRNYDEAINGDPSNNRLFPTQVQLQEGANVLKTNIVSVDRKDREYIRVNVPEGFQLNSIVLNAYNSPQGDNIAFMGIQRGTTFTESAETTNVANLLGYTLFGPEAETDPRGASSAGVGDDLLDDLGATTDVDGTGKGIQGFSGPLGAGNYTFWIQQADGTANATFQFNVVPVPPPNAAPVADDDSYSTAFNTALTVAAANGVLIGDTDANGDALTAAIAAQPTNGAVTLNSNGSFTYTPTAGFSGSDSFTYTVSDGKGGTDTGLVTVAVGAQPNRPPVADDDSYSTTFNTPLTVNAANGVLNGDTDTDGDALTAAIASQAVNGVVGLNANGSFTYTPNAGFSGNDSFAYTVSDGKGGSDTATVTVAVAGAVNAPPVGVNDTNTTNEDTPVTGNVLTNDTDANSDPLTVSAVNGVTTNVGTAVTLASGAKVTVNADGTYSYNPNGQFEALNNGQTGADSFQYTVSDGKGGSSTATANITINGVTDTVVTTPVVSFSLTPTVISEAEGTALVMNFNVVGDIPPEGIIVNLTGDAARIMQQFTVAQTRFDAANNNNTFYRFDNAFVTSANVVGGTLDRFSLEDGDPSEVLSNEAAAGTGFLSNFKFKITAPTASITFPVLNDSLQEVDQTFTYTLAPGTGYEVSPTANSGTFTVTDGVVGTPGPTVRIAATPGTLYEQEPSVVTITLTATGTAADPIPPEGVVVFVEGPPRAIAEFDVNGVNNTNPRPGNPLPPGPIVTGGAIVGTNETAGGFFVRILPAAAGATTATTTIKVPVFKDPATEAPEGSETLTFTLRDGELYNLSTTASQNSVTLTIEDTIAPPVVTLASTSTVLNETGGVVELTFATTGAIPPGGITAVLEITDPDLFNQISRPSNANSTGITIPTGSRTTITDANGKFVKVLQRVTITEPNATLRLPVLEDILQETDKSYAIKLIDSDGYNVDAAAANTASFTLTDGTIPAIVPTVSVTATPTALFESEQTAVTLTFATTGTIPAGGLQVFLDSGVLAALGEFDVQGRAQNPSGVVGPQITGGAIVGTDNDISGVFLRLDANTTTLTIPVLQDNEIEGTEIFTYRLVEGEAYNVSSSAGSAVISISDNRVGNGNNTGRDTLLGTDASEGLTGLGGRDTITTGAGDDLIVYTSVRDGVDTINDFTIGSDKFDLRQIMRGQNLTLSYADTVAQGYLKFGSSGADGVVQFDLDGNAGPNRAISLALVKNVSATNLNQAQNFLLA
jgi:VCBS repeat-containing protein